VSVLGTSVRISKWIQFSRKARNTTNVDMKIFARCILKIVQECSWMFECQCIKTVAYSGIFFGGVQQIQLRTEDREDGDLGAVAP